jgi:hypothetical protein
MSTFVPNTVSSGSIIYASDHNELGNRIAAAINGGLDDTNISGVGGSKVTAATLPSTALDAAAAAGWIIPSATFTYNANNGAKEFVLTPSVDPTGYLAAGMKLKLTRGTVPPTQSMAFASASSQSASKSSPSGITFTGNFTCEAWIYLLSYPSATAAIVGRDSAAGSASGWEFAINSSGQLVLVFRNGSGSSSFNTYQAVPLNRWVHVAAAATVATPTAAIYMNALSIPGTSTATAATTVVQPSTNLALGKGNNTTGYLNGYLSEVRVWSTAQSLSNIKSNMAISLSGSESNLVALFQGNGNFNDKTSNANNLTANNSAIATQAANPYNATEYAIITKVASNAVTVFCGTDFTIPNLTLSNVVYSTQRAPFGFAANRGKWRVEAIFLATRTFTGAANTWYEAGQLSIPTGEWMRGYRVNGHHTGGSSVVRALYTALGQTTAAASEDITIQSLTSSISTDVYAFHHNSAPYIASSQTINYLNMRVGSNATSASGLELAPAADAPAIIFAECAYV